MKKFLCLMMTVLLVAVSITTSVSAAPTSSVYTISGTTVSGVPRFTPVSEFLKNINAGTKTVKENGTIITQGCITENTQLEADGVTYDICLAAELLSGDFDSMTGSTLPLGFTVPVCNSGITYQGEAQSFKGGKSLKIATDSTCTTNSCIRIDPACASTASNKGINFELSIMLEQYPQRDLLLQFFGNTVIQIGSSVIYATVPAVNKPIITGYELNKWYHIVFAMDTVSYTNVWADVYLNGNKVTGLQHSFLNGFKTATPLWGGGRFNLYGLNGEPGTYWIDDVKVYPAYPKSYDIQADGGLCSVTSDALLIDSERNVIYIDPNLSSVLDVANNINLPTGSEELVFFDNGTEIDFELVDPSQLAVTSDMKLCVRAVNGVDVKVYSFEEIILASDKYRIDNTVKTIKNVACLTPVNSFLNNLSTDRTVTLKKNETVVTQGYVEDGMTAVLEKPGEDTLTYTISLASFALESNFNDYTGTATLESHLGDNIPAGFSWGTAGTGMTLSGETNLYKGGSSLKFSLPAQQSVPATNFFRLDANGIYHDTNIGTLNIEFSFMAENYNKQLLQIFGMTLFSTYAGDKGMYGISNNYTILNEYSLNKWYHFVFAVDTINGNADVYINGEYVVTFTNSQYKFLNGVESGSQKWLRLHTYYTEGEDTVAWYDDIKIYQVYSKNYDYEFANAACAVSSDTLNIDQTKEIIYLAGGVDYTVGDIEANINVIGNEAYYSQGVQLTSSDAITANTVLCVRSQNEAVVKVFAFEELLATSAVYDVDNNNKTIGGVLHYTSVNDFLDNLTINGGGAVYENETLKTNGYISDDMILRVTKDNTDYDYSISLNTTENEDFETGYEGLYVNSTKYNQSGLFSDYVFTKEDGSTGTMPAITGGCQQNKQGTSVKISAEADTCKGTAQAYTRGYTAYGNMAVEFSLMSDKKSGFRFDSRTSENVAKPFIFINKGDRSKINILDSQLEFEANKWYHIAVSLNFKGKEYTVFVNGVNITGVVPSEAVAAENFYRFKLQVEFDKQTASTVWFDDYKRFLMNDFAYSPAVEGKDCAISSDSLTIDFNHSVIALDNAEDYTVQSLMSLLTVPQTVQVFDADGILISNYSNTVTYGTQLAVLSEDGFVARYYKIVPVVGEIKFYNSDNFIIDSLEGTDIIASADVFAGTGTKDAVLFLCMYDNTSKSLVKSVIVDEKAFTGTKTMQAGFTAGELIDNTTVKAFIWDDIAGLRPLCNVISIQ